MFNKHITPCTVVITSLLGRDKPIEAPAYVKRVCYHKCNEVEEAHGELLLSLLNVRYANWSVPQFQKDEIECMIYDVYVN